MEFSSPFLYITISLILGILFEFYIGFTPLFLFSIFWIFIVISIFLYIKSFKLFFKIICILMSFFVLGMLMVSIVNFQKNEYIQFSEKEVELYGIVDMYVKQDTDKTQFVLRPLSLEYQDYNVSVTHKVKATIYGKGQAYKYGDILKIKGILVLPKNDRNPGGFNYQLYLKINGIDALIYADSTNVQKLGVKTNFFKNLIYNLDLGIKNVYYNTMPPKEAGILTSMIIGDRTALDDDIQENFIKSGVMHILAISGFNIAVILYFANFLLSRLRNGLKYVFLIFLVFFYALLSGGSPSVIRAALMAVIYLIGKYMGRDSDSINSLSISAFIILIINPLMLFDVGFQLSYMATLSLIIFYPRLMEKVPKFIPKKISEIVVGSISSQLMIIPLFTNYFYGISLVSVFTNLIVIPLSSLLIPLGLVSGILGLLNLKVAFIIDFINTNIIRTIIFITNWLSGINFAFLRFYMSPLMFFGYYLFLIVLFLKTNKFLKKVIIMFLIIFLLFFMFDVFKKEYMVITFLDVGQGDSIVIRTPGNKVLLIDGGGVPDYEGNSFDTGKNILIPFLYRNGINAIDIMVLTHSHDDHLKGLITVLNEMKVKEVITGPYNQYSDYYDKFLQIIRKNNIGLRYLKKGNRILLDNGIYIDVLNPSNRSFSNTSSDMNNNSLVLKVVYGNVSILLTGDIEKEAEEELLKDGELLDSDIIKVAHHGSAFSSNSPFIERVSPFISIIEVGYNNYGQPDDNVLKRLESISTVFRTDKDGAIILKTDGHVIYVETHLSKKKFKFIKNGESGD